MFRCTVLAIVNARRKASNQKLLVLEHHWIKSAEGAKRLLIPPVYSLRGISAYAKLQIVTEDGQIKQTVKYTKAEMHSGKVKGQKGEKPRSISCFSLSPDSKSYVP